MAVLDVVLYPDDPLMKKADAFDGVGPDALQLADDMLETMHAYDGVGLAGPQVGIAKRILVLEPPEAEPMCLINPVLSAFEGSEEGEEGCLSLPQLYATVKRAASIHVQALNEHGEAVEFDAEGFLARVIQHEFAHLEGKLFPDRVDIMTREALMHDWREIRETLQESARLG